jgi:hypothetical protein
LAPVFFARGHKVIFRHSFSLSELKSLYFGRGFLCRELEDYIWAEVFFAGHQILSCRPGFLSRGPGNHISALVFSREGCRRAFMLRLCTEGSRQLILGLAGAVISLDAMKSLLIFGTFLVLSGCVFGDPAYPPVVRNVTDSPVNIVLKWINGPDQPGYLPAGTACSQRLAGRRLRAIWVRRGTGTAVEYNSAVLARLRAGHQIRSEEWMITEGGLALR